MVKRLTVILLTFALCTSMLISVNAADTQAEVVSIDEYMTALQEIADDYDLEVELIEYDADVQITREMLDRAVLAAREKAESFVSQTPEDIEFVVAPSVTTKGSTISPKSMSVTKTVYGHYRIENMYGSADMRAEATVIVDMQNSYIIDVSSTNARQYGSFVNLDEWNIESITVQKNNPSYGTLQMTIVTWVKFLYTDPVLNVLTGWTSEETDYVSIFCG